MFRVINEERQDKDVEGEDVKSSGMKILKKQFRDKCCHGVATASNATFPAKTVGSRPLLSGTLDYQETLTQWILGQMKQYNIPFVFFKLSNYTSAFSKPATEIRLFSEINIKIYYENP